jgi:hypothetical protein
MTTKKIWQPPEDEIPGYTSYLYRANRPRRDDEYWDSWKRNALATLGVGELESLEDAEIQLSKALKQNKRLETQNKELETANASNEKSIKELSTKKDILTKKTSFAQELTDKLIKNNTTLREQLRTYGEHTSDCQRTELAASGRLFDLDEIECTCGWNEVDTKEH